MENEDLSRMIDLIESRINEEDKYTSLDMAAAFLKHLMGDERCETEIDRAYGDFGDTGAEEGMVRLFINIGKKQKIRPGDILGAIAGKQEYPVNLSEPLICMINIPLLRFPGNMLRMLFRL